MFRRGNYTYVFSAVLTLYLLGNVIGAGSGARLTRRLGNPAAAFGISLTCLGIFGIAYVPWLNVWNQHVSQGVNKFFGTHLEEAVLPLIHSAALFLLPSVAMGIGTARPSRAVEWPASRPPPTK